MALVAASQMPPVVDRQSSAFARKMSSLKMKTTECCVDMLPRNDKGNIEATIPMVALTCAALYITLNDWTTGVTDFEGKRVQEIYDIHVGLLQRMKGSLVLSYTMPKYKSKGIDLKKYNTFGVYKGQRGQTATAVNKNSDGIQVLFHVMTHTLDSSSGVGDHRKTGITTFLKKHQCAFFDEPHIEHRYLRIFWCMYGKCKFPLHPNSTTNLKKSGYNHEVHLAQGNHCRLQTMSMRDPEQCYWIYITSTHSLSLMKKRELDLNLEMYLLVLL
ncbi:hypothetical protein DFH08DRAFT_824084 [Mycena albidolilacea]|uniref:DUF6532 domain-containing protein n=1 Tax=Mycena albidolilacea TaxID=1033008 RepID=A0AAD6Z4M8_9AGAR|nr:hypothetical protein DFH08DRAFT_824084 [Mycena albidolilacea]